MLLNCSRKVAWPNAKNCIKKEKLPHSIFLHQHSPTRTFIKHWVYKENTWPWLSNVMTPTVDGAKTNTRPKTNSWKSCNIWTCRFWECPPPQHHIPMLSFSHLPRDFKTLTTNAHIYQTNFGTSESPCWGKNIRNSIDLLRGHIPNT